MIGEHCRAFEIQRAKLDEAYVYLCANFKAPSATLMSIGFTPAACILMSTSSGCVIWGVGTLARP